MSNKKIVILSAYRKDDKMNLRCNFNKQINYVKLNEHEQRKNNEQEEKETDENIPSSIKTAKNFISASAQEALAAYAQGNLLMINGNTLDSLINRTDLIFDDVPKTLDENESTIPDETKIIIESDDETEPTDVEGPIDNTNGINGEIDEKVSQGGTGDCWLIAGVLALNSSETGKRIIKESIQQNSDGSVTVHFKGKGVSYTISADEIKEHDTDDLIDDAYSNGDNDMLVIELAIEKYLDSLDNPMYSRKECSIEGGISAVVMSLFTGCHTLEFGKGGNTKKMEQEAVIAALKRCYETGNTALTFSLTKEHRAKLTDGSKFKYDDVAHCFAISKLTSTTVTFINPWDSETEYTMTWKEFGKLQPNKLTLTDLSPIATEEEMLEFEYIEPIPEPELIHEQTLPVQNLLGMGFSLEEIDNYFVATGSYGGLQGIALKTYTLKAGITVPWYDGEIMTAQQLAGILACKSRQELNRYGTGLHNDFIDKYFQYKQTDKKDEFELVLKPEYSSYRILEKNDKSTIVELILTDGSIQKIQINNENGDMVNLSELEDAINFNTSFNF